MNKKLLAVSALSAALLFGMAANDAVYADQGGKSGGEHQQAEKQGKQDGKTESETKADESIDAQDDAVTNEEAEAADDASADDAAGAEADDDSGKGDKKHGLENAYEHTKDKPAGQRIAELLKEKYGIDVSAEDQEDPAALVAELEAEGNVDAAAEAQAEIVQEDPTDVEAYVVLGKLKEKHGQKGIKAYVNGKEPKFDVPPVQKGGRVLVPFRAIAEALDAEVAWDSKAKTVTVMRDGIEVKLVLGSSEAYVNGEKVMLDVSVQTFSNRVVVPLRFLSEAFKLNVVWEPETSSVIVVDETASEAGTETEAEGAAAGGGAATGTEAGAATDTTTGSAADGAASTDTGTDTQAGSATDAGTTTDASTTADGAAASSAEAAN